MARKPTDQVQLKLRFDEKLRRKLELAAERADRSMNAEIIYRLEQSFADSDILTRIEKKMDEIKDGIQETQDQQYERLPDPRYRPRHRPDHELEEADRRADRGMDQQRRQRISNRVVTDRSEGCRECCPRAH